AGAGVSFARFRKLHGHDAALAPGDAATSDGGVEKSEAVCRHAAPIVAPAVITRLGGSCYVTSNTPFAAPSVPLRSNAKRDAIAALAGDVIFRPSSSPACREQGQQDPRLKQRPGARNSWPETPRSIRQFRPGHTWKA